MGLSSPVALLMQGVILLADDCTVFKLVMMQNKKEEETDQKRKALAAKHEAKQGPLYRSSKNRGRRISGGMTETTNTGKSVRSTLQ